MRSLRKGKLVSVAAEGTMKEDDIQTYERYRVHYGELEQAASYTQQFRPRRLRDLLQPSVAAGWFIARLEALALRRLLRENGDGLLVDVPCGSGKTLEHIPRHPGDRVVGVDSSKVMLSLIPEVIRNNTNLLAADIRRLPFRSESVRIVVCIRFLHRFSPDDRMTSLFELARVANSDLILYYSVRTPLTSVISKCERSLRMGDRHGLFSCSRSEIESELRACGLSYVRGISAMPFFSTGFMVLAAKESKDESKPRE